MTDTSLWINLLWRSTMKLQKAWKRAGLNLALLAGLMLLGACAANAAPITYQVNRTIGVGSVIGTITTDGTTGVLATADITNWDLVLNGANSATFNLTGANSKVVISGSDVTATATDLLFDFGAINDGYLLFQVTLASGTQYYCDAATSQSFWCNPGETVVPGSVFDNPQTYQYVQRAGNQVIGTVPGGGNPMPEPATLAMVGLGLVAAGSMGRRRVG